MSTSKVHSHYENLKVARNAPLEVIRAAYRVLAQKHHPDVNASGDASRVMLLLNEAWETLSDPEKRAAHDKWILEEETRLATEAADREAPPPTLNDQAGKGWAYSTTSNQWSRTERPSGRSTPDSASAKKSTKAPEAARGRPGAWSGGSPHAATEGWRASEQGGIWQRKWALLLVAVLATGSLAWWATKPKTLPTEARVSDSAKRQESVDESRPATPQGPNLRPFKTSSGTTYWIDVRPGADIQTIVADLESNEKNRAREKSANNSDSGGGGTATFKIDPDARQKTGYLDSARGAGGGLSTFTIDNTQGSQDVVARMYLDGRLPAVRNVLVKQGTTFTIRNLAPGTFVLRYRYIGSEDTYEADRPFVLTQVEDESGTRYSNMTVTLYGVRNGNLSTKRVPMNQF